MSATILVVDDEENARSMLDSYLSSQGYEVLQSPTLADARNYLSQSSADIILLDVKLPDGYGPALLEETALMEVRPPVILITAYGEIEMAVEAMKNGAHDFLQKPIQLDSLHQSIQRAEEIVAMRRELVHLRSTQLVGLDTMIAKSPIMKRVLTVAQRAASSSASVLITGETGTGKEVMARAIHQMGPRAHKAFVAINCAAIQPTVLESELFGYEAGAFTGAEKRKNGLMETADGGILFLDEIATMPMDMQAKLLRALEEHSFRRVGGTKEIKVDVQILAASNMNLPTMVQEMRFRDDLFYRLNVLGLYIPPLRERKEEIPDLVGLFIRQLSPRMGVFITDVTPRAMEALMNHDWPGNIRELRNVIERAMIMCDEEKIDLQHLNTDIFGL
ncbi:MAG: sigma-54-dependent transcriptional regulator [Anaerolineales bacterium]|jgi:two-component system response regulator AtoC